MKIVFDVFCIVLEICSALALIIAMTLVIIGFISLCLESLERMKKRFKK